MKFSKIWWSGKTKGVVCIWEHLYRSFCHWNGLDLGCFKRILGKGHDIQKRSALQRYILCNCPKLLKIYFLQMGYFWNVLDSVGSVACSSQCSATKLIEVKSKSPQYWNLLDFAADSDISCQSFSCHIHFLSFVFSSDSVFGMSEKLRL